MMTVPPESLSELKALDTEESADLMPITVYSYPFRMKAVPRLLLPPRTLATKSVSTMATLVSPPISAELK